MTPSERLAELEAGQNPRMIARMKSGFAVMSESQWLPGYCLLLAYPEISQLTDLDIEGRTQYLLDLAALGDAVLKATGCLRVNYSILGNLDPFLHAHVWPRFSDEPQEWRFRPPTDYPEKARSAPEYAYEPAKHDAIRDRISLNLEQAKSANAMIC